MSIADTLRREIERSDLTLNSLAKTVGILQPALWRFVHEKVDPKLEAAEKLLDYFGYTVVKKGGGQLSSVESSRQPKQAGNPRSK